MFCMLREIIASLSRNPLEVQSNPSQFSLIDWKATRSRSDRINIIFYLNTQCAVCNLKKIIRAGQMSLKVSNLSIILYSRLDYPATD